MKLRNVFLCLDPDCEEIFEPLGWYRFDGGDFVACPACGGRSARLSKWVKTLNHETEIQAGPLGYDKKIIKKEENHGNDA